MSTQYENPAARHDEFAEECLGEQYVDAYRKALAEHGGDPAARVVKVNRKTGASRKQSR